MADFPQVWEEFFGVLFKEELCDIGVLQAPRAYSVGHAGRGRGLGRSSQSLSGSATRQPPLLAHLQDCGLMRTNTWETDRERSVMKLSQHAEIFTDFFRKCLYLTLQNWIKFIIRLQAVFCTPLYHLKYITNWRWNKNRNHKKSFSRSTLWDNTCF